MRRHNRGVVRVAIFARAKFELSISAGLALRICVVVEVSWQEKKRNFVLTRRAVGVHSSRVVDCRRSLLRLRGRRSNLPLDLFDRDIATATVQQDATCEITSTLRHNGFRGGGGYPPN